LAKTTKSEEDLDFFQGQYYSIKQSIEEEFDCSKEQVDVETEQNHVRTECNYEAEIQHLSERFDSGYLSEENSDSFASELEQSRDEAHQKIEEESAQTKSGIGNYYDWQMQALKNLYKFSSLI
jgi:hypothetical protein